MCCCFLILSPWNCSLILFGSLVLLESPYLLGIKTLEFLSGYTRVEFYTIGIKKDRSRNAPHHKILFLSRNQIGSLRKEGMGKEIGQKTVNKERFLVADSDSSSSSKCAFCLKSKSMGIIHFISPILNCFA
jgi:hypothetical protein